MDWTSVIVSGLVGACAGAIGAGIGAILERAPGASPASDRKGYSRGGATVGVVLGMVLLNGTGLRQSLVGFLNPPSELEASMSQLLDNPQVAARFRGKSPAEVKAMMRSLTAAGMPKLEDEILIERARLLGTMLSTAAVPTCARFAAGTSTEEEIMGMIGRLSPQEQAWWGKTIRRAVEVELGATARPPVRQPSDAEIAAAMGSITRELTEPERLKLLDALTRARSLPPAEACAAVRTLYRLVAAASMPQQAVAARALMMP